MEKLKEIFIPPYGYWFRVTGGMLQARPPCFTRKKWGDITISTPYDSEPAMFLVVVNFIFGTNFQLEDFTDVV